MEYQFVCKNCGYDKFFIRADREDSYQENFEFICGHCGVRDSELVAIKVLEGEERSSV